jgi:integrating conjugative element protein (TIGR03759 family)
MSQAKPCQALKSTSRYSILTAYVGVGIFMLNIASAPVLAAPPDIIAPQITHNQLLESTTLKQEAKTWGLTQPDYQRYLWLMKHTPSGHWYRSLDPSEVLALNATTQADMMKYAKIQAQAMHQRVARELAFNKLYSKAYHDLYPDEQPITSEHTNFHNTSLQPGDHVWLFTGVHTPLGSFVYQHLIKTILKHPKTQLDIYFFGQHTNANAIQQWAINNQLPQDKINKQISLNFGSQRFKSLTQGKSITLPFVGVLHQQHFQPVTLSSVL